MAIYTGTAGIDKFLGANNVADSFRFKLVNLQSADTISGGAGATPDRLDLISSGAVTAALLGHVSGIEMISLGFGGTMLELNDAFFAANGTAGKLTIVGSSGADAVNAATLTAGRSVLFQAGAGNDSFAGGAGNDSVAIAPIDLTGLDTLAAGTGSDSLLLRAPGTSLASAFANVSGFEQIVFAAANTSVELSDAVIAANSAAGRLIVTGTSGADAVEAAGLMAGRNIYFQAGAGNDSFAGGAGNDTVIINSLTALDSLAAGAGSDGLILRASGAIDASAFADISGFEQITVVGAGISLGLDDSAVAANNAAGRLALTGTAGADNVSASGLSVGRAVVFQAGAGNDSFAGGAGNDLVWGGTGSDRLSGGGGIDRINFAASVAAHSIARLGDGSLQISDGAGGIDIIAADIELLSFTDKLFDLRLAPKAPAIAAIINDTGKSSSDFITSDGALVISGTADAGMKVEIFLDGLSLGSTDSNGLGKWAFDYSGTALADASYVLTATATNAVLVKSAQSSAKTVSIDTVNPTAPDVTLSADTGSSNSDLITSTGTLSISGTEPGSLVGYSTDGGTNWTSVFAAVEGANTVLVRQTDAAGNISSTASFAFTLDTSASAPAIVGYMSDTGDSGDGITSDSTLTLSGTAEAFAAVIVFDGAAELGAVTADGTGKWSFDTATLDVGSHSFTATSLDLAGNTSPVSSPLAIEIQRVIDLAGLALPAGFAVKGAKSHDLVGKSVASAGDIDGDGFDDLIIGAPQSDTGGAEAGAALVVFGDASGLGPIDLANLAANQGFLIYGDAAEDFAGWSVASAGDVNGDGFDDMIVGVPFGEDAINNSGEAYVVFGKASGFGTVDLGSLTSAEGFAVRGGVPYDQTGRTVAAAGDVNGDGFGDLIIGAPFADGGGSDAGAVYVVFGKASGFGAIEVAALTPAQGFMIQGDAASDKAGRSIAAAGDINGDGFGDLIIGAAYGDDGGSNAGEAYVVFGKASGFGAIDLGNLSAAQGFIIQGDAANDQAGWSVASAGDVNGDGFDDLVVGARLGDDRGSNAGEAYVVFGKASGFANVDLTSLTAAQGIVIQGDAAFDNAGYSVASAGDVNGDGFNDLIIGAVFGDDGGNEAGEAYVVFGKAGLGMIDLTLLTAAQGFVIQGDAPDDRAGLSVASAGDVNGDGFDDLVVGVPYGDDGGTNAGEAYVVFGGAFGRGSTPVTSSGTSAGETLIGGLGSDTLAGGGGADVFRGGAGKDVLGISDNGFADIDGGRGSDTLRLDGFGIVLDFSLVKRASVTSLEVIDLTGTGDNSLILGKRDLLAISDDTSGGLTTLTALGDVGDSVATLDSGWTAQGTVSSGNDLFTVYLNGRAQLLVDSDISTAGILF